VRNIFTGSFPANNPIAVRDTAYAIVEIKAYESVPAPSGLQVESGDGRLRLHWPENSIASYSGYMSIARMTVEKRSGA